MADFTQTGKELMNTHMILRQKIEVCDLHLLRMKQALEHIQDLYPFSENLFPLQKYEDLASLELFTSRFAKLQDYMGEILFPAYLEFVEESIDRLSMIDRLNKLEKYGILSTAQEWKDLRELRNKLAHEYPNSFSALVVSLNAVFERCGYLEQTLKRIKDEYANRF